jgi:hypothetical protein
MAPLVRAVATAAGTASQPRHKRSTIHHTNVQSHLLRHASSDVSAGGSVCSTQSRLMEALRDADTHVGDPCCAGTDTKQQ